MSRKPNPLQSLGHTPGAMSREEVNERAGLPQPAFSASHGHAYSTVPAVHFAADAPTVAAAPKLRRVVLESPYAGDIPRNINYARLCVADALARGEAPLASHLLYTQPGVLRDDKPDERAAGIAAGHAWLPQAEALVVYEDFGISEGMRYALVQADAQGIPVEFRKLGRVQVEGPTPSRMQTMIARVCAEMCDMLQAKNRAYGNSVGEPVRIFSKAGPREAMRVRMDDKLSRIMRGQAAGEDAPWDLAGYLVLERCLDLIAAEDEAAKDADDRMGIGP